MSKVAIWFLVLMVLVIPAAPLTIVLGQETHSRDRWEAAYSRRGYQLGMTLSEFKEREFPDQNISPDAYAICSNDPEVMDSISSYPNSRVYGRIRDADVVKCHYYYIPSWARPPPGLNIEPRRHSAQLLASKWGTSTDFYFVRPSGESEYLLFNIISTTTAPLYENLLEAFTAVMGAPNNVKVETVQNPLGATYENSTVIWENEVSTLTLTKYFTDLRTLGIILIHNPLSDIVEQQINRALSEQDILL